MTYVDSYLIYPHRDMAGWPTYASKETQDWCVEKIREYLSIHHQKPQTMESVRNFLFRHDERPEDMRGVAGWDAQYALVHRALLVDCEKVWRLNY